MDELRKKFRRISADWEQHCCSRRLSSLYTDFLEHTSYQELVQLGKPAIPLIMECYEKDDWGTTLRASFWVFAVEDITGVQMIPDRNHYSPVDVKKRCLEWWDREREEWIKEYCSGPTDVTPKQATANP